MYDKYCKTCRTSLSSFYSTSMLGCPDCYKAFEPEILSALTKIQGRTFHVGKSPNNDDRELLYEYQTLLKEKEYAGLEGRFSDMHALAEQLNVLKEELKNRGLI